MAENIAEIAGSRMDVVIERTREKIAAAFANQRPVKAKLKDPPK